MARMTEATGSVPSSLRPMLGAVLAGGQSRRFGRDKTLVEVDGVPMAARAAHALAQVCDEVVLVSSQAAPDVWDTVVPDLRPGLGPLAGIEAALRHGVDRGAASVFVLAADLPQVGPDIVEAVAAGAAPPEPDGRAPLATAASREGDPDFEPLCAVYRIGCLQEVTRLLDHGERAARALVAAVGGRKVVLDPEAAQAVSVNINVPDDLDRIP